MKALSPRILQNHIKFSMRTRFQLILARTLRKLFILFSSSNITKCKKFDTPAKHWKISTEKFSDSCSPTTTLVYYKNKYITSATNSCVFIFYLYLSITNRILKHFLIYTFKVILLGLSLLHLRYRYVFGSKLLLKIRLSF